MRKVVLGSKGRGLRIAMAAPQSVRNGRFVGSHQSTGPSKRPSNEHETFIRGHPMTSQLIYDGPYARRGSMIFQLYPSLEAPARNHFLSAVHAVRSAKASAGVSPHRPGPESAQTSGRVL